MAGLGIGVKGFKSAFFDSEAVVKRLTEQKRKLLSELGAFVRQRARSSIRKRKGVSAPGSPPSSHVGTLKKLIFFAYDERADSVVVGPASVGLSQAPGVLEHGGAGQARTRGGAGRRVVYRARPFMRPAFEAERPNFRSTIKSWVT